MGTTGTASRATQRARLAELVAGEGLRAAVISSYQALSYFARTHIMTQVSLPDRLEFLVVFDDGRSTLLVCDLEASMVRSQSDVEDVREYVEFAEVPARALADLLKREGITSGRIGIEARRLHAEAFSELSAALPDVEAVPIDDAVERLQSIKEPDEVEQLRYGAQATLDAVTRSAAGAGPGTSELAFCADVLQQMMVAGGVPSFIVFGAGERALQAHAEALDQPLRAGDIWRIDVGARFFDVINSDLARTGVVGEPSSRQEEILLALRATQDAGFAVIEPGRPAGDVFRAVRDEFGRQGLPFFMPHIGHGLGIGLHEFPILEPGNGAPLEPGMVLNVEPMVRVDDHGECYHTEDLALVTEDGFRLLTQPQDALIRMDG
jgi:Xaa-Pro dipeptidase